MKTSQAQLAEGWIYLQRVHQGVMRCARGAVPAVPALAAAQRADGRSVGAARTRQRAREVGKSEGPRPPLYSWCKNMTT